MGFPLKVISAQLMSVNGKFTYLIQLFAFYFTLKLVCISHTTQSKWISPRRSLFNVFRMWHKILLICTRRTPSDYINLGYMVDMLLFHKQHKRFQLLAAAVAGAFAALYQKRLLIKQQWWIKLIRLQSAEWLALKPGTPITVWNNHTGLWITVCNWEQRPYPSLRERENRPIIRNSRQLLNERCVFKMAGETDTERER